MIGRLLLLDVLAGTHWYWHTNGYIMPVPVYPNRIGCHQCILLARQVEERYILSSWVWHATWFPGTGSGYRYLLSVYSYLPIPVPGTYVVSLETAGTTSTHAIV